MGVNEKVLSNNNQPMWIIDKSTLSILAVNDKAVSCYGFSRTEFLTMKATDLIPDPGFQKLFVSIISESFPLNHTGMWKHRKKDGSLLYAEITCNDSSFNGKEAKLISINGNPGKNKDNEAQNLLAAIVESSENAILSKALDGTINSWNKAAEKMYGYNAEEILGKSVSILIPHELKDELNFIIKKMEKGETIERYETLRLRKDGSRINLSITISPIRDESGNIIGASSIAHDITLNKKLESERKIREKQLLEAERLAHLGYWELDIITWKLEWSEELIKIFGFNPSQKVIDYKDVLLSIHPEDRSFVNNIVEKAQINFQPFQTEFRIVLKDGSIRYIYGEGEVVFDESNKLVKLVGIGQDITTRKRAERRLAAQFEVTRIFVEAKNIQDAAQAILKTICEGTDWQIGELWLVNFESNLLQLENSWNIPSIPAGEFISISRKCKFGPGVSLQGRVWENGKPSWSNKTVEDQFFPRSALAAQLKLHTALAFPVRGKKNISGVITLYRDDSTEPDEELLNMLDSLGQQIGDFIESKQAEPALHESESLYKTLVEISPDAITYTNLSGRIVFCNTQAAQLFGFRNVDEIIDQNLYAFIAPEDQKHAIENEHTIIKSGRTRNIQYTLIKRDRTKFKAEINSSIVFNSEGKPKAFIGVIRDITFR
jgi:PAS domain S-box-containing protein